MIKEFQLNAMFAESPGLTDIELAVRLRLNQSQARGLRGQLVKLGLLADSGNERAGSSGRAPDGGAVMLSPMHVKST